MGSRYEYKLPAHDVEYGVKVAIPDLYVDPQAQRTINEKRAQTISDELVPEAVGSIVVSERVDGTRYIVDGMHRTRACQLAGHDHMVAEVHKGLSTKEEAILFLIKNRESNKPSALDEYKVGLTAGIDLFVDTEKVLADHGLKMGASSTNSIGAVSGVLRITDNYGPEVLDRVLSIAERAWGRNQSTWDGVLLGGLGMAIGRHGDEIDDDALADKMAREGTATHWVSRVHTVASNGGFQNSGTGSRLSTCYRMVIGAWNKGRRKNKIVLP